MRWLDSFTNSVDMNLSKLWEIVKDRKPSVLQSVGLHGVRYYLALKANFLKTLKTVSKIL